MQTFDLEIRCMGETVAVYTGLSRKNAARIFNYGYMTESYAAVVTHEGRQLKIREATKLFLTAKVMRYDNMGRSLAIKKELEALG